MRNHLNVFKRGENLLQNNMLYFVFRYRQGLRWKVRIYADENATYSERGSPLKGLKQI